MNNRPLIELQNIEVAYDEKTVLRDVNLTVYEKDFLGIIGPNGGGKTTLIKVILRLLKPKKGSLRFYAEGKSVEEIKIGYLPQYNNIDKKFPISVYDVILSGLSQQKLTPPIFYLRFTSFCFQRAEFTGFSCILSHFRL